MKNLENNLKEATLKALDHTKELQKPIPFIKISIDLSILVT